MSGMIELARWWRVQQRRDPSISDRLLPPGSDKAKPRTQLMLISKSKPGIDFLRSKAAELRSASGSGDPDALADLGSVLLLLGDSSQAVLALEKAVAIEGRGKEGVCRHACLLERAKRQAAADVFRKTGGDVGSKKRGRADETESTAATAQDDDVPRWGAALEVDTIDGRDITVESFLENYANKGVPVVLTNLAVQGGMFGKLAWTGSHLASKLQGKKATLRRRVKESHDWANLEDGETELIDRFIERVMGGSDVQCAEEEEEDKDKEEEEEEEEEEHGTKTSDGVDDNASYLFDWGLPGQVDEMLEEEFYVPRLFAGDLLQCLPPGSLFRDAWPSLFVGPKGTRSGLHVDSFGSNFWMALLEGTKRWTLFAREETPRLGPRYMSSLDPCFDAESDVFGRGTSKNGGLQGKMVENAPQAAEARRWEVDLQAGQVLFVPSGCAHSVTNLTDTVAISANFVDSSNIKRCLSELEIAASEDARSLEVLRGLKGVVAARGEGAQGREDDGRVFIPWADFKRIAQSP